MIEKKFWLNMPPWFLIGAVIVLLPIFVFWTAAGIHEQKENMMHLLSEKGAALIRSFEAGTRTGMMGMMGMHGGGFKLQRLLMETVQQQDIVYLIVTDKNGKILAHNDPNKIGGTYGSELRLDDILASNTIRRRQVNLSSTLKVFEVFRQFSPVPTGPTRQHGKMISGGGAKFQMDNEEIRGEPGRIIFVGLDMGPIEKARKEDMQHRILMAVILLLIGFAGLFTLFLVQAYRSTRMSLKKVKAFSDNIVENIPMGLTAIDPEGKIVSFNQVAESIFKISATDILNKDAEEILPPSCIEPLNQLKTDKRLIEKETRCTVKNGTEIPLEIIATFLRDENDAFLGYVILFKDLREIHHLKKEVERSRRLASIGRLAAGIAHEIRNPLSSIKGFATYFRQRYKAVPEDQKTADIMIQEVERLDRVIGQLLEFARPIAISKRPVSIAKLVRHALKLIESDARRKNIHTHVTVSPDIRKIMADPDRIKQVLLNIFLNALEAMAGGGTLDVTVDRHEKSDDIVLKVSDTGMGIKEADMVHIFDPYFTTKSFGTGLGLAIVHKIMESHGGEVIVQSRFGEGTTVELLLPVSMEADRQ